MRGRAFLFVSALAGTACVWMACSDAVRSHVFTGRQYKPAPFNCLGDLQSIDVVEGPQPNTPCAPMCVLSVPFDGGTPIAYVSTMCAPYPIFPYDSDAGSDPLCEAALLANQYNTTCEDDGAILNLPPEAGPDAASDAAPDATVSGDAAADATIADTGVDAPGDAGVDASGDAAPE